MSTETFKKMKKKSLQMIIVNVLNNNHLMKAFDLTKRLVDFKVKKLLPYNIRENVKLCGSETSSMVSIVCCSRTKRSYLLATQDGYIYSFSKSKDFNDLTRTFSDFSGKQNSLKFYSVSNILAAISKNEKSVNIWDLGYEDKIYSISYENETFTNLEKINFKFLAVGTKEKGKIIIWNLFTNSLAIEFQNHLGAVTNIIKFSKNEILSSCDDSSFKLWTLSKQKPVLSFETESEIKTIAKFSKNRVAAWSQGCKAVLIYDINTCSCVKILRSNNLDNIQCIAKVGKGALATGDMNGEFIIIEPKSNKILPYYSSQMPIYCILKERNQVLGFEKRLNWEASTVYFINLEQANNFLHKKLTLAGSSIKNCIVLSPALTAIRCLDPVYFWDFQKCQVKFILVFEKIVDMLKYNSNSLLIVKGPQKAEIYNIHHKITTKELGYKGIAPKETDDRIDFTNFLSLINKKYIAAISVSKKAVIIWDVYMNYPSVSLKVGKSIYEIICYKKGEVFISYDDLGIKRISKWNMDLSVPRKELNVGEFKYLMKISPKLIGTYKKGGSIGTYDKDSLKDAFFKGRNVFLHTQNVLILYNLKEEIISNKHLGTGLIKDILRIKY